MMKAIAIDNYGPKEELKIQQLPKPEIGPKDVLIEVTAAAVNPVDVAIRNGWLQQRIRYDFPLVIGWDVAGVVSEIGSEVENFKVGDHVYSYPDLNRNGTYAEFVAVEEKFVAHTPKNISLLEAASLPLVGVCAYRSLVEVGNIQEGQKILILGGAGGVGSIAVQLAKAYGAYVTATTSIKNIGFVEGLGADEVIDYTATELYGEYDLVFDTVGPAALKSAMELAKRNGKIVSVATSFSQETKDRLQEKEVSAEFLISDPSGEILSKITRLVEEEQIKPVVGTILSLEEASKAHELSETGNSRGKIILKVK